MRKQEKGADLRPGWEPHSKHSVEKRGGGSPWGSRPGHSAQRRDGSQSPLCSECRQSAPGATLAREHGSPGEEIKHGRRRQLEAGVPTGRTILDSTFHTVFHTNGAPWGYTTRRPRPRFHLCGLFSMLYGE